MYLQLFIPFSLFSGGVYGHYGTENHRNHPGGGEAGSEGLLRPPGRPNDRRSQLLYPTEKAESLKSSKAEIEAAFYEYLMNTLTKEEAAAFAGTLNKLYAASKAESRAGFSHFLFTVPVQ